jgi:hypothetical protein
MKRISVYFISILIIICAHPVSAQDSIRVPLNIRVGIDLFGPTYYLINPDNLTIEGYAAYEYNSKNSFVFESGYQKFRYSQYNYEYLSDGIFFRAGIDFNLLDPFLAEGKYYAGIGLRYGLSIYNQEVPAFKHDNYWGTGTGSIPSSGHIAHFVEVNPGVRTEIFKNVSIGWNLRLRILIYSGTDKDMKAVSIPGFGNGTKSFSPGINYYIVFNFPYKSVIVKPAPPKVTGSDDEASSARK